MLVEQVVNSLPFVGSAKPKAPLEHPLAPLSASEITESTKLMTAAWPASTNLQFKSITLYEPKKEEVEPYLAAERAGEQPKKIDRRSFVVYYIKNTVRTPSASICSEYTAD